MRTLRPLALWLALAAWMPAGAQTVLAEQSEVAFTTRQMGVPVEGRFKRWSAQIRFDPRQPQAAQVNFTIDTASLAFGAAETEAEAAKVLVSATLDSLSKNWNRQDIETHLKAVSAHLTNIIVAQEFQDLAGQSLRKAMKALVGAIIVVEGGGPTEDKRLSQSEIDGLLKDLMP